MSLERIFKRRPPPPAPPATERRWSVSWAHLGAQSGRRYATASPFVTPLAAEAVAAVTAAIQVTSATIAALPPWLYRVDGAGRALAEDHPAAAILREPNDAQNWPEFVESLVASALLHGNGVAEIEADRAGAVRALRFIPWGAASPVALPDGRLALDLQPLAIDGRPRGARRRLLPGEFLHLRERSDDGLLGRSRLSRCSSPVRLALEMAGFQENLFCNQARPGGILSAEGPIPPDKMESISEAWDQDFTGENAGRVAILSYGLKFQPLQVAPENLEFAALQRFIVEEIARLFNTPPQLIGDLTHGTFTNSQQAARWFATFTIGPLVKKLEAALLRALLPPGARRRYAIELDMSSLLRGDPEARWKTHEIAVKNRILTADEVREVEGFNPRGDAAPAGRPGPAAALDDAAGEGPAEAEGPASGEAEGPASGEA